MSKVFIYDSITKSDPIEVEARYAAVLVKGNPRRWAVAQEETKQPETVQIEAVEVVEEKPKPRRRRRKAKTEN